MVNEMHAIFRFPIQCSVVNAIQKKIKNAVL